MRGRANGAVVELWDESQLRQKIPEARSASGRASEPQHSRCETACGGPTAAAGVAGARSQIAASTARLGAKT